MSTENQRIEEIISTLKIIAIKDNAIIILSAITKDKSLSENFILNSLPFYSHLNLQHYPP